MVLPFVVQAMGFNPIDVKEQATGACHFLATGYHIVKPRHLFKRKCRCIVSVNRSLY